MDIARSEYDVPLWELVDYQGPQLREAEGDSGCVSVQTLNSLARTQPDIVASVLADWIDSRPALPR
jgi:hypothetical protein